MKIKFTFLFSLLLMASFSIRAQVLPLPDNIIPPAVEHYKEAEEYILQKDYEKAIKSLKKCLKIQPGLSAAHRGIGICYSLLNDFDNAVIHFEIILESDSMLSRALYFELAESYYKSGSFKKALDYFEKYKALQQLNPEDFGIFGERELERENEYNQKIEQNLRACEVSLDSLNFGKITNISNLGGAVNTIGDEYFPFLSNDQTMLFFTHKRNSSSDENLMFTTTNNLGNWKNRSPFKYFNTPADEGRFTMVRDGKRMYFTTCEREGVQGPCDIWEGIIEGDEILEIKPVTGKLNSRAWESQVSVSCDGSLLFFASNKGNVDEVNSDIWYSKKLANGEWSEPIKLGPHINTPGSEQSPFLTNDGKTLYFSSDGHLGFGGMDIFMCWFDKETEDWSTPINIGQPLNTPHSELGFFLCADGKTGYFASDKPNGALGINWDIYKFELSEELYSDPITFVEGHVRDSVLDINLQTTINIKGRDPVQTDKNGRFFLCLQADSQLDVNILMEKYDPYKNVFNIPAWDNRDFYRLDLWMNPVYSIIQYDHSDTLVTTNKKEKIKEKVPNDKVSVIRTDRAKTEQYSHTVFFKFDSYELKPDETDKIVGFLNDFEGKHITRVEIIGYADDIGPDTYNLKLSEERAKKLALFLMEKNLEVDQIYLEGKGEIRDDKPKDLNRKVDIKIYTQE